jgi:chaperonin GroES
MLYKNYARKCEPNSRNFFLGATITCELRTYFFEEQIMTNFVPLHDRILVRRSEDIETSRGGIVLPDNAKEKPLQGLVVAVGEGRWEHGNRVPLPLKEGDRIVFGKYAGTEIKIDEQDYIVLRENEVLGIVSSDVQQVAAA